MNRQNYYYLLNHGSLVLLTRYMLLQTYRNKIRVFPTIPSKWRSRGVEFANLPAEGGYTISGKTDTSLSEVEISTRDSSRIARFVGQFTSLEIIPTNLDIQKDEMHFDLGGTEAQIEIAVFNVQRGEKYSVDTGKEGKVIEAELDLRFSAEAPVSIRIKPV